MNPVIVGPRSVSNGDRGEVQLWDMLITSAGWRRVFMPLHQREARSASQAYSSAELVAMRGTRALPPKRGTAREHYPSLYAQDEKAFVRCVLNLVRPRRVSNLPYLLGF